MFLLLRRVELSSRCRAVTFKRSGGVTGSLCSTAKRPNTQNDVAHFNLIRSVLRVVKQNAFSHVDL